MRVVVFLYESSFVVCELPQDICSCLVYVVSVCVCCVVGIVLFDCMCVGVVHVNIGSCAFCRCVWCLLCVL